MKPWPLEDLTPQLPFPLAGMVVWPPADADLALAFTVYGSPKAAGSKNAFIPRRGDGSIVQRSDGKPMVVVTDDSGAKGKAWRQEVASAAMGVLAVGERLSGPLVMEVRFFRVRPRNHYGSGRNANVLKPSAPAHPTTRPDVLKLARAVEDALSSVVYGDDAQIVDERIVKAYGLPERAEVRIWTLPATAAGEGRLA